MESCVSVGRTEQYGESNSKIEKDLWFYVDVGFE